jgi:hypothetical protein
VPLEVREIGIRMQVGEAGQSGQGEAGDGASPPDPLQGDGGEARARLIEQCVEAVLAELARRSER